MTLETIEHRSFRFFVHAPWWNSGVVHGFIGAPWNFTRPIPAETVRAFLESFSVSTLFDLEQIHGADSIDLDESTTGSNDAALRGDALIATASRTPSRAISVRTADCLPILMRRGTRVGAVHAGWRGLASNIAPLVAERLGGSGPLECVIGPCAGADRYEVGPEVVDAIGVSAVFRESNTAGKFLLDLAGTARAQLAPLASMIASADHCTISDKQLHSFRRDGVVRGSNLGFIAC